MLSRIAYSIRVKPKATPSLPLGFAGMLHTKNALEPDMEIRRHQATEEYLHNVQDHLQCRDRHSEQDQKALGWWNDLEEVVEASEAIRAYRQDKVVVGEDMMQRSVNNIGEMDVMGEESSRTVCGGWATPPRSKKENTK